jgi:hypothetical protein
MLPIMKTILLAFVALTVSVGALRADHAKPSYLGAAPVLASITTPAGGPTITLASSLTLPQESNTARIALKLQPNGVNFAQLETTAPAMPFSSSVALALVAAVVLALRVMGLNHARAMADHERDSYHGKDRMYRALREDDMGR